MHQGKKIKIIVIVGPTASGKTTFSVNLAKYVNGEIISADSMQIYREMNIGTAKPTIEEMNGIRHHLIDFLDPHEKFSVAEYVDLAKTCINDIIQRGKQPIICGGTGLYIDALIKNIVFDEIDSDYNLREELMHKGKKYGGQVLIKELSEFDPISANTIHPNNLKRISRAIEIYRTSGLTMTEHKERSRKVKSFYDPYIIGLNYKDRSILYDKINKRVDLMMEKGLLDEAKKIFERVINITAFGAIGYKEIFSYIKGECRLQDAVEKLKTNTRNYAKRQITWFKKNSDIIWFER